MSQVATEQDLGVNPTILKWARERAGLTLEEAAGRAKLTGLKQCGERPGVEPPTRLQRFEEGLERISWRQLEQIAKAYRRPPLIFFLSTPPIDPETPPDFRTTGARAVGRMSPELLEFHTFLVALQENLREIREAERMPPLSFVGSIPHGTTVSRAVTTIRGTLGVTFQEQVKARNSDDLFKRLRDQAHEAGIFVVVSKGLSRVPISVNEYRGLALSDPFAPLAAVNSGDADSAKLFTLIHELTHLGVGQSAISDFDPFASDTRAANKLERFANAVAAEFLVPAEVLREFHVERPLASMEDAAAAAARFKVSRSVVGRRAFDLGMISEATHQAWQASFYAMWKANSERQREKLKAQDGGPTWTVQVRSRFGQKILETMAEGIGNGVLSKRDAAALLRVKTDTLEKLVW